VCVRSSTMDTYNNGYALFWLKDCIDSGFENISKSLYSIKKLTKLKDIDSMELS
jgi:hypothetical protein